MEALGTAAAAEVGVAWAGELAAAAARAAATSRAAAERGDASDLETEFGAEGGRESLPGLMEGDSGTELPETAPLSFLSSVAPIL